MWRESQCGERASVETEQVWREREFEERVLRESLGRESVEGDCGESVEIESLESVVSLERYYGESEYGVWRERVW